LRGNRLGTLGEGEDRMVAVLLTRGFGCGCRVSAPSAVQYSPHEGPVLPALGEYKSGHRFGKVQLKVAD
jgi:hypothetical protein